MSPEEIIDKKIYNKYKILTTYEKLIEAYKKKDKNVNHVM